MSSIYEMVESAGFEFTRELRSVKFGDWYMGNDPANTIERWSHREFDSLGEYLVLRKIKRTFEFDGQKFECPEGYVFERVGLVRETDIGKYFLDAPDSRFGPELVDPKHWQSRDCIYAIFRKESK